MTDVTTAPTHDEPDVPDVPDVPGFARSSSTVLGLLLAATTFGTAFLRPRLPYNLDLVDGLILVVAILGFTLLLYQRSPLRVLFTRCLPFIWLVMVGILLSFFGIGFARWSVIEAVRNLSAYFTFFAMATVIAHHRKGVQWAAGGYLAALPIVIATTALEGGYRPSGTFVNPNYTGNFLLFGILLLFYVLPRRWFSYVAAAVCLVGIMLTDSLGALTMLAVVLGYSVWRNVGRLSPILAAGVKVLLVAIAVVGLIQVMGLEVEDDPGNRESTSQHYRKSSERRTEIWEAGLAQIPRDPLGWGPGAVDKFDLATGPSLHSDYLAYLIENSAVALVGAIGFFVVLWRHGDRMGPLRPFIVAMAAGAVTREVMNFRHIWMCLSIALIADMTLRIRRGDVPPTVQKVLSLRAARTQPGATT